VLRYLVEEGLVSPQQAKDKDVIFRGYSQYFDGSETAFSVDDEHILDDKDFKNESQ
jgi:hypothetical protein